MTEDEVTRIERVYEGYMTDDRVRRRWSPDNPGNARIDREREAAAHALLEATGLWPPTGYRLLDLGCGAGRLLRWLIDAGAMRQHAVGIDVLAARLSAAKALRPRPQLVRADGAWLPFRSGTFRLVSTYTVFSSILDDDIASAVATEMDRVLEPGGTVLWYDFRVGNPWNRNTKGMSRRRIAALFPGYRARLWSVTLLPQIARRLGALTRPTYAVLAWPRLTRTHYVGVLTKP